MNVIDARRQLELQGLVGDAQHQEDEQHRQGAEPPDGNHPQVQGVAREAPEPLAFVDLVFVHRE